MAGMCMHLDIAQHSGALELRVELALELLGVQPLLLVLRVRVQTTHDVAFWLHGCTRRSTGQAFQGEVRFAWARLPMLHVCGGA